MILYNNSVAPLRVTFTRKCFRVILTMFQKPSKLYGKIILATSRCSPPLLETVDLAEPLLSLTMSSVRTRPDELVVSYCVLSLSHFQLVSATVTNSLCVVMEDGPRGVC